MKLIPKTLFVPLLVALAGCNSVHDAAQQVAQAGSAWKVAESADKLTRETILTATTESANDDKTLLGQLALECRIPSKKLQLIISSFSSSGDGLQLEDSIAVRVRGAAPASLLELFSGAESSIEAQGTAFGAVLTGGSSLATPLSSPAPNVIRVQFDALLANLKRRADLARRIAAEPAQERADQIAHADSLRAQRASSGDTDTTAAHLQELIDINVKRRSEPGAPGMTAHEYNRRQDSLTRVIDMVRDELKAQSTLNTPADDQAGNTNRFAEFARSHFGDLTSYKSAADLLRGMGPEIAFQYYNKGRSNTLILKTAEVSSVLDRCR